MSRSTPRGVTLIEMIVVFAILAILMTLLLPAVYFAREAARRAGCQANLHQLGMAMSLSVQARGKAPKPPAAGVMSGWAIEILPFIEEQALADGLSGLSLTSPAALALAAKLPPIMRCPSGYDGDSDIPGVAAGNYGGKFYRQQNLVGWDIGDLPTDTRLAWVTSPETPLGIPRQVSFWAIPHVGGFNVVRGGRDMGAVNLQQRPWW